MTRFGVRGRSIELPKSGIYTQDGFLFHHVGIVPLSKEHIERIREYGILYEPMKRFTPEEDKQLRKNWLRFSNKHSLPYEDIRYYVGHRSYKDDKSVTAGRMERLKFLMESDFWPKMCHKLPHRSAQQVRARLIRIFDPALILGHQQLSYSKKLIEWSEQDIEELLHNYSKYESDFDKIGEAMGRTAKSCECKIHDIMARSGPIRICRWKRLWKLVTNLTTLSDVSGKSFGKIVRKAIYDNNCQILKEYNQIIPWKEISRKMIYDKKHCKQAWEDMLNSLQRGFNQETSNGRSFGDAWVAAYQQILESPRPISCKNYGRFLHILLDETPVEATYESLSKRLYDIDNITRQLENEGVTGFYSGCLSEVDYLFSKTACLIRACGNLLFRRLRLQYTLKEKVHIISLAFDEQGKYSTNDTDGNEIYRRENSQTQNSNELTSPAASQTTEEGILNPVQGREILSLNGFPALRRAAMVEALIVYSTKTYDDWIPPTALKKYVESEEVLKLFQEEKNNSELYTDKDKKEAYKFLDFEVSELSELENEE